MAAAVALEAVAPKGVLWDLVHDFVMGQQEGPADQVAADLQFPVYDQLRNLLVLTAYLKFE